jgi:AcrR family transcriptional regulator
VPLPRFHRLSDEQRARILAAARAHIAEHGADASYNQIIAFAGISKASAYHYFDGKADLFSEVRRALDEELAALLGPWTPVRSIAALWRQLRAESVRLRAHFAARPGDLVVLAVTQGQGDGAHFDRWFDALIDNGVELGLVRTDVDRALVRDATRALFSVFDARAIAAARAGEASDDEAPWELLRGLWAPRPTKRGAR